MLLNFQLVVLFATRWRGRRVCACALPISYGGTISCCLLVDEKSVGEGAGRGGGVVVNIRKRKKKKKKKCTQN